MDETDKKEVLEYLDKAYRALCDAQETLEEAGFPALLAAEADNLQSMVLALTSKVSEAKPS